MTANAAADPGINVSAQALLNQMWSAGVNGQRFVGTNLSYQDAWNETPGFVTEWLSHYLTTGRYPKILGVVDQAVSYNNYQEFVGTYYFDTWGNVLPQWQEIIGQLDWVAGYDGVLQVATLPSEPDQYAGSGCTCSSTTTFSASTGQTTGTYTNPNTVTPTGAPVTGSGPYVCSAKASDLTAGQPIVNGMTVTWAGSSGTWTVSGVTVVPTAGTQATVFTVSGGGGTAPTNSTAMTFSGVSAIPVNSVSTGLFNGSPQFFETVSVNNWGWGVAVIGTTATTRILARFTYTGWYANVVTGVTIVSTYDAATGTVVAGAPPAFAGTASISSGQVVCAAQCVSHNSSTPDGATGMPLQWSPSAYGAALLNLGTSTSYEAAFKFNANPNLNLQLDQLASLCNVIGASGLPIILRMFAEMNSSLGWYGEAWYPSLWKYAIAYLTGGTGPVDAPGGFRNATTVNVTAASISGNQVTLTTAANGLTGGDCVYITSGMTGTTGTQMNGGVFPVTPGSTLTSTSVVVTIPPSMTGGTVGVSSAKLQQTQPVVGCNGLQYGGTTAAPNTPVGSIPLSITSASITTTSGGVGSGGVTFVTAAPHGMAVNQVAKLAGYTFTSGSFLGQQTVTAVTLTTFTIAASPVGMAAVSPTFQPQLTPVHNALYCFTLAGASSSLGIGLTDMPAAAECDLMAIDSYAAGTGLSATVSGALNAMQSLTGYSNIPVGFTEWGPQVDTIQIPSCTPGLNPSAPTTVQALATAGFMYVGSANIGSGSGQFPSGSGFGIIMAADGYHLFSYNTTSTDYLGGMVFSGPVTGAAVNAFHSLLPAIDLSTLAASAGTLNASIATAFDISSGNQVLSPLTATTGTTSSGTSGTIVLTGGGTTVQIGQAVFDVTNPGALAGQWVVTAVVGNTVSIGVPSWGTGSTTGIASGQTFLFMGYPPTGTIAVPTTNGVQLVAYTAVQNEWNDFFGDSIVFTLSATPVTTANGAVQSGGPPANSFVLPGSHITAVQAAATTSAADFVTPGTGYVYGSTGVAGGGPVYPCFVSAWSDNLNPLYQNPGVMNAFYNAPNTICLPLGQAAAAGFFAAQYV